MKDAFVYGSKLSPAAQGWPRPSLDRKPRLNGKLGCLQCYPLNSFSPWRLAQSQRS